MYPIGSDPTSLSGVAPSALPARVALAGFGTVGRAVAQSISNGHQPGLQLTRIFNRNVERKKVDWVSGDVEWTEEFGDLLAPDVDIVVELAGGLQPAGTWVRRALEAGKAVVTANKQLIAHEGAELLELARRHGVSLRFEAAVGGAIPVIRALQEGLAADEFVRVSGILNGTCNYILSRMQAAQIGYATALAEAQALGFAEADPADDVDGMDARAKLVILAAVGLGRWIRPGDVPCRSIRPIDAIDLAYANRLDCVIRQVSRAERTDEKEETLTAFVGPALVHRSSSLARVEGSQNLIAVEGKHSRESVFSGLGAGGHPTAVAVLSDVLSSARGPAPTARAQSTAIAEVAGHVVAPHYLRFIVADRPGIIASIAEALARRDINIDAVWQEPGHEKLRLPFVMTVEACSSAVVQAALRDVGAFDFHVEPPLALPIL